MSENIGDLKLSVILDTLGASKNADKFSQDLKKVSDQGVRSQASLVKMSDAIQNVGLRFQGLQSIISVLKSTFGDMIRSYQASEIAVSKLNNGLKNLGEGANSMKKLSDQASNLQKITVFGDDEITNAQAMLTTFMLSSEQIELLTPRMLDLASAYQKSGEAGMDLQSVATMIGKVNEETLGSLKRVGVAFTQEQAEKLKSLRGTEQTIELTKILDQNFKGLAQTIGETSAGKIKIMQNAVGDLKEEWGKLLLEALMPLVPPLKDLIKIIQDSPPNIKTASLSVVALATAFTVLNGAIPGTLKFLGILVPVFIALPDHLKGVAIALGGVAVAVKVLGRDTGGLVTSFKGLAGGSVLGSVKGFASSMLTALNPVAIMIGILSYGLWELKKRMDEVNEKQAQSDYYQSIRDKGGKIFLQTEDEKYDITSGTDAKKTSEHTYIFTPGKGFEGQETNTGIVRPEISPDQRKELQETQKAQDEFNKSTKTGTGNVKNLATETGKFKTKLEELNEELESIKSTMDSQTQGENILSGLSLRKSEIESLIADIIKINTLGYEAYLQEKLRLEAMKEMAQIREKDLANYKQFDQKGFIVPEAPDEEEPDETYARIVDNLREASSLVNLIGSKLDEGGNRFLAYINQALLVAIKTAEVINKANTSGKGAGLGDILSIIGTVLPFLFLSTGGSVPGSGNSDTVPAMLTPGEYVLNKKTASKLGPNFLQALNGGGSVAPRLISAPSVGGTLIVQAVGDLSDLISFKIVDKGMNIRTKLKTNTSY